MAFTFKLLFIILEHHRANSPYSHQVAQIRITNKEFPFHAINLAVGAELSVPITYRDALGINN